MALVVGLHEELAEVARIAPQTVSAAATGSSDVVDIQNWDEVLAIFQMGDYASGNDGSVAVGVYYDTASNGSFANLVQDSDGNNKSLTTATFTGSSGDNQDGIIRVTREEVAAMASGARYIRLKATPSNEDLLLSAVLLGRAARYAPASNFDLAAVGEIIS